MAHHQQTNHDRIHAAQVASISMSSNNTNSIHKSVTGEDDAADVDEPPDLPLSFSKVTRAEKMPTDEWMNIQRSRKASLLTQALGSPELTPYSEGEAPFLTSDGGLTSPARTVTPSPPFTALSHARLPVITPLEKDEKDDKPTRSPTTSAGALTSSNDSQESKVAEGLGRKRCITFACSQKQPPSSSDLSSTTTLAKNETPAPAEKPSRPCMLRFACPAKPSHASHETSSVRPSRTTQESTENKAQTLSQGPAIRTPSPSPIQTKTASPATETKPAPKEDVDDSTLALPIEKTRAGSKPFNRVDFSKSEATRFHEFAGSFTEDDEWTREQTAYREKITIDDTLRKENAIRKIGEDAEREALEEDADDFEDEAEVDEADEISDDGNESDDEGGFAASDDVSDAGSDFQFWTPGLTTAATSTDNIDHIRVHYPRRLNSQSSMESTSERKHRKPSVGEWQGKRHRSPYPREHGSVRTNPSGMQDSSEFFVGTIDEDRPMEEKYANRRKRREKSKQKVIPQDIDPSFPNSDPEAENDDDDEPDEQEASGSGLGSDNGEEDRGDSDATDDELSESQSERPTRGGPSKRLRSPPPARRNLFNQTTHRLRSPPPPTHRRISSPPSSRRPSPNTSTSPAAIKINRLAQRPNLTHTTSLPRTPNPFWARHRQSSFYGLEENVSQDTSNTDLSALHRGPIAIVQALETKRQRRKEKFWRQHIRIAHAGKDKDKKCQPGKGAQRMRELGLEMADRFKGYKQGQGSQIVVSI